MSSSPLATPSATLAVLKRHGLYTKKSLGQHFLIDDNIVDRILLLAAIRPDDVVLEVGPGIGTLTIALAGAARSVIAVEQDAGLLPVLAEITAASSGLVIVGADAVTVPVSELIDGDGRPPLSLVANLPYGVAATVVLRYFQEIDSLRDATVMVQFEVAGRMAAVPRTKSYGAYTVKLGLLARAVEKFPVPRDCFLPPPHVDSAVIRLERVVRPESGEVLTAAGRVADAAFAQRRKTIRNSLRATIGAAVDVDALLSGAGVDPGTRAEALDVDTYVRMGAVMCSLVP